MFWPIKWVLTRLLHRKASRVHRQFHELTKQPTKVQREHLFAQLRREQESAFGRDHRFHEIRTVEDFRRHLPITKYEYYVPYIERVKAGDTEAMFHKQKVLMFAMTSGTTATRKYIPVTKRFLDDYRRGWLIWGLHMYQDHNELWFKTMVQLASNWNEFETEGGIPCGSISGLTAQMQNYVVRKTYCLPPESTYLKDVHGKYYLAWRLGLVRNVGMIISANPSTLVNIARFGTEHAQSLVRDIRDGTIASKFEIPESIRQRERKRLMPNPERARELEEILNATGALRPKDVWPNLGLLGNWTGGSVGAYMRHYPEYFGEPAIRDIGLIASEGRMTIPIDDNTPGGILEITSSFFEFVPVDEMDSPNPTVLESHELQEGKDYYILLTTASGLYRYNIYDVVRCVGWHEKTPVLAFLNKGAHFSNLTGEKLSEHQVTRSVEAALSETRMKLTAYSLAPCWDDEMPYYGLFVEEGDFVNRKEAERFVAAVERQLRQNNSEYKEKRDTHRLAAVRLQLIPTGTWKKWDHQRLVRTGGTAEQYKHPCLIPSTDFQQEMPVLEVATALR